MFRRMLVPLSAAALSLTLAACGAAPTATAPTAAPAAPTAVSAAATAAPAAPTAAPAAAATAAPAAAAPAASVRTFRIQSPQTEASYTVQKTLLAQNNAIEVIGKTTGVSGEFQVDAGNGFAIQSASFSVDLTGLNSGDGRRDGSLQNEYLEFGRFPTADFTATEVQGLPATVNEGEEISFKLLGTMKIRDVSQPVTFDVKGTLANGSITGTATSAIKMTGFGFNPPTNAFMNVADDVTITVNFTAQEATSGY
ncbi:MAG: YceI family protein [Chloroflexaceae bacterium]|jgi:polyisoprenoid-binding protein YceI|nr:YceI family protein [Chloroflexaceae bacterium]